MATSKCFETCSPTTDMKSYLDIVTIDYLDGLNREVVFWAAEFACTPNINLWRFVFDQPYLKYKANLN